MKTESMESKVRMTVAANRGARVASQPKPDKRTHEFVIALALIVTPISVLCWMARANSNGNSLETTASCCAAVIVLLLTLVGGLTSREKSK